MCKKTLNKCIVNRLLVFFICMLIGELVHAEISMEDIEKLNALIQTKAPLEEIEKSIAWKKLDSLTEDDFRLIKSCPIKKDEQESFLTFQNKTMMLIYKYIVKQIQECEERKEYDHEIDMVNTLYSFVRLHFLDVDMQSGILKKIAYPLYISGKLSIAQKKRLVRICRTKLSMLPIEKFTWNGTELSGEKSRKVVFYNCSIISSEFIINVMETILENDSKENITRDFDKRIEKMLKYYGITGVYKGNAYRDSFNFYLITREPLYFHYANQEGCAFNGETKVMSLQH